MNVAIIVIVQISLPHCSRCVFLQPLRLLPSSLVSRPGLMVRGHQPGLNSSLDMSRQEMTVSQTLIQMQNKP